jgi:hypothetical protein
MDNKDMDYLDSCSKGKGVHVDTYILKDCKNKYIMDREVNELFKTIENEWNWDYTYYEIYGKDKKDKKEEDQ